MGLLFASVQAVADIVQAVLQVGEPTVCALGRQDGLRGRTGLGGTGLDVGALLGTKLLAGSTLNLAQAGNVATLKVAVSVLELPESGVGVASVKDVALCSRLGSCARGQGWWGICHTFVEAVHVELSHKGGDIGVLEILAITS